MNENITNGCEVIPSKKKKCILYHMGHYGFISKMLLHMMTHHKNSDVVFILDQSYCSDRTCEFVSEWNEKNSDLGIIYGYSDWVFKRESDPSLLEDKIASTFDNIFRETNTPFENFDKIYSGFDLTNAFGVYASIRGRKYILFDMEDTIGKKEYLYNLSRHPDCESAYWKTMKKYRAFSPDSTGVSSIIWDMPKELTGEKDIVIDYVQIQKYLTRQEKNRLTHAFIGKDVNLGGACTLVVMASNMKYRAKIKKFQHTLSTAQQFLLAYRLLADYCCEGEKIIFKSHPNYDLSDIINKTFPNAISLPGYFPFELLPLSDGFEISKIVNIGSSSTRYIDTETNFLHIPHPHAYFDHYLEMNLLNTSLHLSRYLYGESPSVYCNLKDWDGILSPLLIYLAEGINLIKGDKVNSFDTMNIIYDSQVESLPEFENCGKSCVVVLNPSIASVKLFQDNAAIIKIKKVGCMDQVINYVGDLDPEYLMLFSSNRDIVEATKRYTVKKDLIHCGIRLECFHISNEDFFIEKQDLSKSVVSRTAGMGNEEALGNILKWLDKLYKNKTFGKKELFEQDTDSFYGIISTLADTGDSDALGHLGRIYRDGKGVEKDLYIAAEWMRKAIAAGAKWPKNELFDILWKIGTPESYEEMILLASEQAKMGNDVAMVQMGRAYRYGKGVEKDLNKAAEWMRKATTIGAGAQWPKNELFDVLWQIGTSESYEEMILVAKSFADKGNGEAMGRLGRTYRDGRGVEKDLNKAAEWMRKAVDKDIGWAKNELIEILSKINDQNP